MRFSSLPFLFGFLPITLAIYFAVPLRWRNLALLLASLVFYSWGEPVYISIMVLSILIDYTHGLLVEKYRSRDKLARWFVAESVLLNLGLLGFFKYWDFFAANLSLIPGVSIPTLGLPLPIGISFFTFQTMSYTIDVYRQDAPAQRNMVSFGAYVTMFPQLIAGPIVRYSDIAVQLKTREHSVSEAAAGARRFILGLAKKILLANLLGELVSSFRASADLSILYYWLGAIAFTLQIYYDFSGYSDMAIGLGRMFGFHFLENFNYPYISLSVTEFWRRWHISLSTWFRDYVYIPLGGNRVSRGKWVRNILVVWGLTGLWHGADWNFLLWGLGLFGILTVEKLWLKKYLDRWPVLGHLYMLVLIPLSWAVFSVSNLGQLGAYFGRLLPLFSHAAAYPLDFLKYGKTYGVFLVLGLVCSTSLPAYVYRRLKGTWAGAVILAVLFWLCLFCLSKGMNDPFMYFRF